MAITAALVKELRERTGAGMMDCKKALAETDGDMQAAIDLMRKSGQAKAEKKAGRTAADGAIIIRVSDDGKKALMVEVNSETDFVAKDENFIKFSDAVADCLVNSDVADVETLMAMPLAANDETTVEQARQALISKIGENINVRRFVRMESSGQIASYRHGVRIGVLVDLDGGNADLGRDLAMHIAAHDPRPVCVSEDEVPAELIEKEKAIFTAQAKESGKPDNIIEKMITGRIRKFLGEVTLLGQAFVKDPDTKVGKLLEQNKAQVAAFKRFEVGEGIEKKQENFADEVMAQVKAAE